MTRLPPSIMIGCIFYHMASVWMLKLGSEQQAKWLFLQTFLLYSGMNMDDKLPCICLHSLKLTQPLKKGHAKRKLVFQPSIFRCHVSFREGITVYLIVAPSTLILVGIRKKILHPQGTVPMWVWEIVAMQGSFWDSLFRPTSIQEKPRPIPSTASFQSKE